MKKILIIFAHPRLESSRTNARLVKAIPEREMKGEEPEVDRAWDSEPLVKGFGAGE